MLHADELGVLASAYGVPSLQHPPKRWQAALIYRNRRVLEALYEEWEQSESLRRRKNDSSRVSVQLQKDPPSLTLSRCAATTLGEKKYTRYSLERHMRSRSSDFDGILGFAIAHVSDDVTLLNWVFQRFRSAAHRSVRNHQFEKLAKRSDLAAFQWLHTRGSYVFPAMMMEVATEVGDLPLVHFLHECGTEGCTSAAMDRAASNGFLDVVRFLHEHRSEGCTSAAQGGALENGHADVLEFLHRNRSEGCAATAVVRGTMHGRLACIKYAHAHCFRGFPCCATCYGRVWPCRHCPISLRESARFVGRWRGRWWL